LWKGKTGVKQYCSELQSISAILSFCRVMFQVLVLSCMDERAERAERALGFVEKA
jgi:hypothetical protein